MAAKWREFSSAQIYQFYAESATQKEFFMKMGYKESKDYSSTMKEFKKVYPDIVFGHSKYRLGQRIGNIKLIEECGREVGSQLVIWKCECDCGKVFTQTTKHFKTMCPDCSRVSYQKSVMDDITNQQFNFLIPIEPIIEAEGAIRWKCKCTLCGRITHPILASSIKGGQVKSCGCLKSNGEQKVVTALEELGIEYIREYSFPDLCGDKKQLRFDFALFKNDKLFALIECNGEQHYNSVPLWSGEEALIKLQEYDQKKKDYCLSHNIPLYIIRYQDYNKINADFIKDMVKK